MQTLGNVQAGQHTVQQWRACHTVGRQQQRRGGLAVNNAADSPGPTQPHQKQLNVVITGGSKGKACKIQGAQWHGY
jgi:hypothetical protein